MTTSLQALRPFRFDRTWAFDVHPEHLWATLARTEDYPRWWPWLRELSGAGLVPGGSTDCVIRAPVPYALRLTLTVTDLVPGQRVEAVATGDLSGQGRLELTPKGRTSLVRLAWEVELRRPVLRAAGRFGRPLMEWGHDWVVNGGIEQFCRHALGVEVPHDDHNDDRGAGAA